MAYVKNTRINGRIWNANNWSVFRETVRTNNYVEGWHRRINAKAGRAELSFYILVPLLLREAEPVDLQMRLVSENLLNKLQRKKYSTIHAKLFELWDKNEDEEISTSKLLKMITTITGRGPTTTNVEEYVM